MKAINATWKYGRFFIASISWITGSLLFIAGATWLPYFLGGLGLLALVLDLTLGTDENIYYYDNPTIFYPLQYASQISGVVTAILFAWLLGTPNDFLGISAGLQAVTGYDMLAAHSNAPLSMYVCMLMLTTLSAAIGSIGIGHELTHRVNNPTAVFMGRLGEAFGMHTRFSIRHPYGHHNWVCTPKDPATARRGENFYPFVLRSIIGQNIQVWELEKYRLEKMGLSVWSYENKALRGWGMEALVALMFFAAAGPLGVLAFLGVGLGVNIALEFANYVEHYGLIRVDEEPQQVRHAWNDNHKLSYWATVAISRHAHHHANADIEFWDLRPFPNDAPAMPFGYALTIIIAAIPPVWHWVMNKKLINWDENFASESERNIAAKYNLESGQDTLVAEGRKYFDKLAA
ncbi:MAG: alkane 1-monooxygenase [Gammaproteobacteria bacterium]|nr:alkane 1-monooxygenase [Gammaproteobacteria bacterium]